MELRKAIQKCRFSTTLNQQKKTVTEKLRSTSRTLFLISKLTFWLPSLRSAPHRANSMKLLRPELKERFFSFNGGFLAARVVKGVPMVLTGMVIIAPMEGSSHFTWARSFPRAFLTLKKSTYPSERKTALMKNKKKKYPERGPLESTLPSRGNLAACSSSIGFFSYPATYTRIKKFCSEHGISLDAFCRVATAHFLYQLTTLPREKKNKFIDSMKNPTGKDGKLP